MASPDISEHLHAIYSHDLDVVLTHANILADLFSEDDETPVEQFVERNALPRLIQLVKLDQRPDIQSEVTSMLINILAGPQERVAINFKVELCPILVRLMGSDHEDVAFQAAWALANIACERSSMRDLLIELGFVAHLIGLAQREPPRRFLSVLPTCVHNLFYHINAPPPPPEIVMACWPIIAEFVMHPSNGVALYACWVISYIARQNLAPVPEPHVIDRLLQIVKTASQYRIFRPALIALRYIAPHEVVEQCWEVFDMIDLLPRGDPEFAKRYVDITLRVLEDIMDGSELFAQTAMEPGVMPVLEEFLT